MKSQNKKQETQKIQEAKTTVKTEKENTPKQTPVAKDVLSMFVGLETNSIE